jgi:hypothetical protein
VSDAASDTRADPVAETSARLRRSREALLAALEGVTEADFAREIDGRPLVQLLAALARDELAAVASARRLLGDAEGEQAPPPPASGEPPTERPATLPPQAIHALAGARYRAARLLDELATTAGSPETDGERAAALALLDAAAEREQRAAERIAGRAGSAG